MFIFSSRGVSVLRVSVDEFSAVTSGIQTFIDLWQPKAGLDNHSHIDTHPTRTYRTKHVLLKMVKTEYSKRVFVTVYFESPCATSY